MYKAISSTMGAFGTRNWAEFLRSSVSTSKRSKTRNYFQNHMYVLVHVWTDVGHVLSQAWSSIFTNTWTAYSSTAWWTICFRWHVWWNIMSCYTWQCKYPGEHAARLSVLSKTSRVCICPLHLWSARLFGDYPPQKKPGKKSFITFTHLMAF